MSSFGMARTPSSQYSVLENSTVRHWSKDVTCWCNLVKCPCDMSAMALRRNSSRTCKPEGLPSFATKTQTINAVPETAVEGSRAAVCRRGRPKKNDSMRMSRHDLSSPGGLRTTTNRPFPFFELPREVRDQVYSNLVVRRDSRHRPVIEATAILKNRKKRVAAQIIRDRLNRQRISSGKRPICNRSTSPDPLLHLDVLRASRRVYCEASDSLYSTNWFAISLSKLPSTVFETPYGWNLSRVKKLQLELQIKDAVRMNSYIDWAPLFASFSSLRVLRIVLTFHPRYYEWAHTELCDWQTTPYVHKAFFRELLAAIPGHVDLKIGSPMDEADGLELQGKAMVEKKLLWDMYAELGSSTDSAGRPLAVSRVVEDGLV